MKLGLQLFGVFLILPIFVYLLLPYGPEVSDNFYVVVWVCFLSLLAGMVFFKLVFVNLHLSPAVGRLNLNKVSFFFKFMLFSGLCLAFVIYLKLGLKIPAFDNSLREHLYASLSGLWGAFIIVLWLLAISFGIVFHCKKIIVFKLLFFFFFILVLGMGMKSLILMLLVGFAVGFYISQRHGFYILNKKPSLKFVLHIAFLLMLLFWISLSLRANEPYSFFNFFVTIYLYLIPPLANFNNIITGSDLNYFSDGIFLGGVFEGFYKILFIETSPLTGFDTNYFVNPTWNVWSFFANLYGSSGLLEVVIGSFFIGGIAVLSFELLRNKPSFFSGVLFTQVLMMIINLHNSFYFQSASPIILIMVSYFISIYFSKKILYGGGKP